MDINVSFDNIHNKRKNLISNNKNKDHAVIQGNNKIVISAPHGVTQVRLGKPKYSEIGSLATAIYLQETTQSFLVAKTKNNNDDANFDEISQYKDTIRNLVKNNDIKFVIDIHGLGAKRDCDVNLGTHIGQNISNNLNAFNQLHDKLIENGFKVSVDQPFMAGAKTISSSIKNEFPNVFTLQIEINCIITNRRENFIKYRKLLDILTQWITYITSNF